MTVCDKVCLGVVSTSSLCRDESISLVDETWGKEVEDH